MIYTFSYYHYIRRKREVYANEFSAPVKMKVCFYWHFVFFLQSNSNSLFGCKLCSCLTFINRLMKYYIFFEITVELFKCIKEYVLQHLNVLKNMYCNLSNQSSNNQMH